MSKIIIGIFILTLNVHKNYAIWQAGLTVLGQSNVLQINDDKLCFSLISLVDYILNSELYNGCLTYL